MNVDNEACCCKDKDDEDDVVVKVDLLVIWLVVLVMGDGFSIVCYIDDFG